MKFFIVSIFFFGLSATASVSKKDPFKKIVMGELPNQMEYFAVSSNKAKMTAIEFHVKAGQSAEKPEEYGIAHLTEHILFRDSGLKDNMSFLQVFESKGGEVNAYVSSRKTKYIVKVPEQHGLWALKLLTKMLQNRKFNITEFKKAQKSVMIEIGEPSPLEYGLKFFSGKKFSIFKLPTFWKSEFGVDFSRHQQPWNADRVNNFKLSLKQAQDFYESFYVPKNIQVFVAGKFNQNQALSFIKANWGQYKNGQIGKTLPPRDEPQMVERPFYSIESSDFPSMSLGVKVGNLSIKDFFILDSYMEFTADKVMKDVRNKKGETYTAYSAHSTYKRHGKIYVRMDTASKTFNKNFQFLKNLLFKKAQTKGLNEEELKQAKLLFKNDFEDSYEESADRLLKNLFLVRDYKQEYGFTGSPIELISKVSLEEYNSVLKKYIQPNNYIIQKYPRHLLFFYEGFLLSIVCLFLSVFFMRRILKDPHFDHFQIRFIKNIKMYPLKLSELGILGIALLATGIIEFNLEKHLFYNNPYLLSNLVTGVYLDSVIGIFLFVGIFIFLLSRFAKRIYLTDNSFYIKSISYRTQKIHFEKIQKFESIKCWKVYFSISKLRKIRFKFYMYRTPFPWRKALLLYLKNGRIILLDCGITDSILKGLNQWLESARERNGDQAQTCDLNLKKKEAVEDRFSQIKSKTSA